jgi:putative ABC transport system permease protein
MLKIPLAWLQLQREKLRFAVALAGVSFAVTLMLMQLGFRESLFESAVRYLRALDYDVILLNPETPFIANPRNFSRRRVYQTLAVEGVASVVPLYASAAFWKNPWDHQTRRIFVVGFEASEPVLDVSGVRSNLETMHLQDVILFDEGSRPEYGPVARSFRAGETVLAELNNREVRVGGLFKLGTSFGIDGSIVVSDVNFLRIFPDRSPGLINFGLVRISDGRDPAEVASEIERLLPDDVIVLTRAEFISREKSYWDGSTPIGYVFTFGVIVGLVVGAIIVYQILFADVSDHLPEYATLKAMGYSNGALSAVVLQQALILAVLGYFPGFAICLWLYQTAAEATLLPIEMTLDRSLGVLVLTIAMCSLAGLVAMRKVRAADPAEIF